MPFQQEELKSMLKSLKEIEDKVIAFQDEQKGEYDRFIMFPRKGKHNFKDFSEEVTANIGYLQAACEWKLTEEDVTEVKKALAILIEDMNEWKGLEGKVKVVDEKVKKLCEEIIAKLKEILSSMEGGKEYKLGL